MSVTQNITINAGQSLNVSLPNWASIATVIFSNSSQYDIIWAGFGAQGPVIIPAGQQWRLEGSVYNAGLVTVQAIDTLNVGGAGPLSITAFNKGEPLPEGQWPVTVPAQRVITPLAGSVVADHLINIGAAGSGSPIIQIQEAGATGSQMQADNQGNFFISEYVSSVLTTLFRVLAGVTPGLGNSNILIGDATRQAEVLGSLKVDKTSAFFQQMIATGASPGTPGIESLVPSNAIGFYAAPNPDGRTGHVGYYFAGNSSLFQGVGFQVFGDLLTAFDASQMNDSANSRPFKWATGDIKNDGNVNNGTGGFLGTINNGSTQGATINNLAGGAVAATINNGVNGGGPSAINNGNNGNPSTIVNGASGVSVSSTLTQYGQTDTQVLAAGAVVLNGGTSGTATLYQFFRGNVKTVICKLNNFRTAGADQRIQLPVQLGDASHGGVVIMSGDTEAFSLQLVSGTDLTVRQLTVINTTAGGAGTTVPTTTMNANMFYNMGNGFLYLNFKSGWAGAHGGIIQIWGCEG
jgi:hypothetical protein